MRTLLLVDDDPQTLASLREALGGEFHLVYATNGAEALHAATQLMPSLIVLDISLPDVDGIEVCRRLKARPVTHEIPVIFVTGLSEGQIGVEGFNAGGVDFISKPILPDLVLARVKSHLSHVQIDRLESAYRDAISMLAIAGEYKDSNTGLHTKRMAAMSGCLAKNAGWRAERVELMEYAAAMHDIGKIGISGSILLKPGPLNSEEWEEMRRHPQLGHDILSVSDAPVFQLAAEIALCHHERWDGKGYPNGLAGSDIPQSARIVALADVFDALTSERPYKKAWSIEEAAAYIQSQSGSHFDPSLVELLIQVLPELVAIKNHWDSKQDALQAFGENSTSANA